jgi:hypothetical protein
MDKISGYIVANGQGGYDVVEKTSQTANAKPFTIPISEFTDEKQTTTTKTKNYTLVDYDPFKASSVELPGYIHTKTEPTRSDEEILREIELLAQSHTKTGQDRNNDKRFLELMDEYVSSVSPDRAGILKKSVPEINGIVSGIFGASSQDYSMSDIFQQVDSQRTDKTDEEDKKKEKELIDYLLEVLKNRGKNNVSIDIWESLYEGDNGEIIEEKNAMIKSDMYEAFVKDGVIQQVDFFDPNGESKGNEHRFGESIMGYSGGKLIQAPTEAEWTRQKEVYATYEAAYDFAMGDRQKERKAGSNDELSKKLIDVLNKTYNSTYERLANSSVA